MPGSFLGGKEVCQNVKDLVNISRNFKLINVVAIF